MKRNWRNAHREVNRGYDRKRYNLNREEILARRREYTKNNPGWQADVSKKYYDTHKEVYRKRSYGITQEEYDAVLQEQEYVCAICGDIRSVKGLGVDHDHETKLFRGLLCTKCNVGLGLFQDNIEWLKNAINYLELAAEKNKALLENVEEVIVEES